MKRLLPFLILLCCVTSSFALSGSDILTRARLMLRDTSSDTTRQRFSDVQLLGWLNDGQREANAFDFVMQASTTFQLTAGTTEYSLPSDFLTPWRVTYKGRKIDQTSFNQQDAVTVAWQTQSAGTPLAYYIYLAPNPTIGFVPAPASASTGTITVWYIQQTADLTSTSQIPFNGWAQLYPYHSMLAYYIAFRGFWVIGDSDQAGQYMSEWQQWIAALKMGLGKQPDFNPGFGGRRNQ